MMDHDFRDAAHITQRHLPGRSTHANGGKNPPRQVSNGSTDAMKTWLMLSLVNRVSPAPRQLQLLPERCRIGDGRIREALQASSKKRLNREVWQKGQDRFAHACAMRGRRFQKAGGRICLGFRFADDDGMAAVEDRKMDNLIGEAPERFDITACFAGQIHVREHGVSELVQFEPKAIGVAISVLIQQPRLAHRRQESMRRALWVARPLANFGKREGARGTREHIEDPHDLDESFQPFIRPCGWWGGINLIQASPRSGLRHDYHYSVQNCNLSRSAMFHIMG
jgi:hypothetical protein